MLPTQLYIQGWNPPFVPQNAFIIASRNKAFFESQLTGEKLTYNAHRLLVVEDNSDGTARTLVCQDLGELPISTVQFLAPYKPTR